MDALENLINLQRQVAAQKEADTAADVAWMKVVLVGVTVVAVVAGLVITFLLARSIILPITALTGCTQAVAEGDLTVVAPAHTQDEIGLLGATFNQMTTTLRQHIAERQEQEQARQALQEQVIEAQRVALLELSTPLIPVAEGVVVMPLIGAIDSQRAQHIMEILLNGVTERRATVAILDITGVKVVDTQVASVLVMIAQAVQLLGAQVVLPGIQPRIAQMLVGLGIDLRGIVTYGMLQDGIAYTLKKVRAGTVRYADQPATLPL